MPAHTRSKGNQILSLLIVFSIRLVIEFKMLHPCPFSVGKHEIGCFPIVIMHFYALLTLFPPLPFCHCVLL